MPTDKDRLNDLEKRVTSLENIRNLVLTLCLIFGVSGAWGYHLLSSARTQLKEMGDPTQEFYNAEQKYLNEFRVGASKESKTQFEALKSSFTALGFASTNNGADADNCQTTLDVQTCWGTTTAAECLGNNTSCGGDFTFVANVTFAKQFSGKPQVFFSTAGDGNAGQDLAYAIFGASATPTGANVQGIETTRGRGQAGFKVHVSYIAIGRPAGRASS